MDRRSTLKWILSASTAIPVLARAQTSSATAADTVAGYGTDPDLTRTYHAGDLWPLTLTAQQRRTAAALCDVVIPEDSVSRSASQVGVVDFLDEWVSAPYPDQQADRVLMLEGLRWIDVESEKRFAKEFAELTESQQHAICDDIGLLQKGTAEFGKGSAFFARYRDLTAGGFYTTPEGRKDLGYIGNVPLTKFEGPSADLLSKLGLL